MIGANGSYAMMSIGAQALQRPATSDLLRIVTAGQKQGPNSHHNISGPAGKIDKVSELFLPVLLLQLMV